MNVPLPEMPPENCIVVVAELKTKGECKTNTEKKHTAKYKTRLTLYLFSPLTAVGWPENGRHQG